MSLKEELRLEIFSTLSNGLDRPLQKSEEVDGEELLPKFPEAKNIIEWVTHPKFLNMPSLWEFPQQFEILRDFFELWCPNCNPPESRDCSDQDPIELGSQVLLEHGVCPKCGVSRLDLFREGRAHFYNELVGAAGRRAGKSVILGAFIGTFILHRALCIDDLSQYFGLIPGQLVEMTFIAAAALQAKDTIWETFKNAVLHSPWFTHYTRQLKFAEKRTPGVHVEDFFRLSDTRIEFRLKRLNCVSLNSNSSSAVGRTNLFVALDELAKFDHTSSKRSADEVYKSMKRGLRTIQASADLRREKGDTNPLDAIMGSISSPMWADDKIMRLVRTAEEARRVFAFHKSTYEMNPQITREMTADEYIEDPVGAARDYDAIPPDAFNAFIAERHIIDSSIDPSLSPILSYQEHYIEENGFRYVGIRLLHCISDKMVRRVLVLDAGRRHDSFGMSIAHLDMQTGKVVFDAVVEVMPVSRTEGPPREVHFDSVLEFIKQLNRYIFLDIIAFDRWASVAHVQALRHLKFNVLEFNVDYSAYVKFRKALTWGKVSLLPPEKGTDVIDLRRARGFPIAKALYELRTLQEVMGKKVEKPPHGSDDLIQTLVGCNFLLTATKEELITVARSETRTGFPVSPFFDPQRKIARGRVVRFRR